MLAAHGSILLIHQFPLTKHLYLLGFVGVELFFVLSGYLIGSLLLRETTAEFGWAEVRRFWVRRWLRTVPNYYLFLLLNIGLVLWLGAQVPALGSYFLFSQSLTAHMPAFFGESWSLCIEEWFYLLFPVILLAGLRLTRDRRAALLLTIVAFILPVTLLRSVFAAMQDDLSWNTGVREVVLIRLDACGYGIAGAFAHHYYPEFWRRSRGALLAVGTACLAGVYVLFLVLPMRGSYHGQSTIFSLCSFGALCVLPAFESMHGGVSPVHRGVKWLSRISYSLYLCNLPVSILVQTAFQQSWVNRWDLALLATALWLGCALSVASLNYSWFERAWLRLRDRRFPALPGARDLVIPERLSPQFSFAAAEEEKRAASALT